MSDNQGRKTILICDDDDLLREFYARVLSTQGYDTVAATNGDEAISVLESGRHFSLAIIDLLMPIRSGWELIEYMKSKPQYSKIPVVAITGLATSFDEFENVKHACDAVLHKGDFDLIKFNSIIKGILSPENAPK
jgi:two-component system, sensor histidine kinase and response regulator